MRRKKMSPRRAKRTFKGGLKTKARNVNSRQMRGGYRL